MPWFGEDGRPRPTGGLTALCQVFLLCTTVATVYVQCRGYSTMRPLDDSVRSVDRKLAVHVFGTSRTYLLPLHLPGRRDCAPCVELAANHGLARVIMRPAKRHQVVRSGGGTRKPKNDTRLI